MKLIIDDLGEHQLADDGRSLTEVKRQFAAAYNAPWIENAKETREDGGCTVRLSRPPAADKGL